LASAHDRPQRATAMPLIGGLLALGLMVALLMVLRGHLYLPDAYYRGVRPLPAGGWEVCALLVAAAGLAWWRPAWVARGAAVLFVVAAVAVCGVNLASFAAVNAGNRYAMAPRAANTIYALTQTSPSAVERQRVGFYHALREYLAGCEVWSYSSKLLAKAHMDAITRVGRLRTREYDHELTAAELVELEVLPRVELVGPEGDVYWLVEAERAGATYRLMTGGERYWIVPEGLLQVRE
jgi:hypothetical protein